MKRTEEENVALRREIAELRATLTNPAVLLPETVSYYLCAPRRGDIVADAAYRQAAASSRLMEHLLLARESLTKFHELAFPDKQPTADNHIIPPLPFHLPSPPSSAHQSDTATPTVFLQAKGKAREPSQAYKRKELYVEDSSPPISPMSQFALRPASLGDETPSEEGSPRSLEDDELCDEDENNISGSIRTSDVRSTCSESARIIRTQEDMTE